MGTEQTIQGWFSPQYSFVNTNKTTYSSYGSATAISASKFQINTAMVSKFDIGSWKKSKFDDKEKGKYYTEREH